MDKLEIDTYVDKNNFYKVKLFRKIKEILIKEYNNIQVQH